MTHSPHPGWTNTSSPFPFYFPFFFFFFSILLSSFFFLQQRCLVCHPISPSSVLLPPISFLISCSHPRSTTIPPSAAPPLLRPEQEGEKKKKRRSRNRTFFGTYLFIRCRSLSWPQMTLPPSPPGNLFSSPFFLSFFLCCAEHFNVNMPLSHETRSIIAMAILASSCTGAAKQGENIGKSAGVQEEGDG